MGFQVALAYAATASSPTSESFYAAAAPSATCSYVVLAGDAARLLLIPDCLPACPRDALRDRCERLASRRARAFPWRRAQI